MHANARRQMHERRFCAFLASNSNADVSKREYEHLFHENTSIASVNLPNIDLSAALLSSYSAYQFAPTALERKGSILTLI
jgi:hypothetical protein